MVGTGAHLPKGDVHKGTPAIGRYAQGRPDHDPMRMDVNGTGSHPRGQKTARLEHSS